MKTLIETLIASFNNMVTAIVERFEGIQTTLNDLQNSVDNKVDKEAGKGLSTNDYTNEDRDKIQNLGTMASRNVHISTTPPTDEDGEDGDIWLTYEPSEQ